MKRVLGVSSILAAGIGTTAAIWLSNKPNRTKAKNLLNEWKDKFTSNALMTSEKEISTEKFPIEKAGNPHPHDIDDNNMVNEGAMYSVKFYNETSNDGTKEDRITLS